MKKTAQKETYDELVARVRRLEQLLAEQAPPSPKISHDACHYPLMPNTNRIAEYEREKNVNKIIANLEEGYRNILDLAPDAIVLSQYKDDCYLHVNRAFCEMTEYCAQEALGRNSLDLKLYVKNEDRNRFQQLIRAKGQFDGLEITYQSKSGRRFPCLVSARTEKLYGTKCLLVVATDISQQKEMEAKFLQAQKMEAVGALASGIAHDFNNILMGIQGHCSLIVLDTQSSHPSFEKLKAIEQLVQSGTALTHQLLSIAKGTAYKVKPADVHQILAASADLFGRTHKGITIEKNFQFGLWNVSVDRNQIEQVLLNIFVNAHHAMPDGGRLCLETRNTSLDEYFTRPYKVAPGKYVRVAITDNGFGMSEATLKKAFDPFFTTKGKGLGTGLGLASSYAIINNHRGIIQAVSQEGVGTTITIYLPATTEIAISKKKLRKKLLLGSETILYIDDEKTVLQIGSELLTRLGYRVITARSGSEGVDIYRRQYEQIDLVILDMIMPEMSGEKTFDRLKAINPDARILLASGYHFDEPAQTLLNRKGSDFIEKPFNLVDLSQKIRKML